MIIREGFKLKKVKTWWNFPSRGGGGLGHSILELLFFCMVSESSRTAFLFLLIWNLPLAHNLGDALTWMLCIEDEAEVFEEKMILSIISWWQLWSRPRSSWWRCCHLLLSLSHVCYWQHVIMWSAAMHALAILCCGWYQVTSVIITTSRQNHQSVTPVWHPVTFMLW